MINELWEALERLATDHHVEQWSIFQITRNIIIILPTALKDLKKKNTPRLLFIYLFNNSFIHLFI